ncbi:uncharacterized protein B4U79_03125, partial [Dinothrombium tinctorium]
MAYSPVWLNCSFDLENDKLYSIKWYKNNNEFYRYVPRDEQKIRIYSTPGMEFISVNFPNEGPTILGLKSSYKNGEKLTAMCTAKESKPSAELKFYINDAEVADELVKLKLLKNNNSRVEQRQLLLHFILYDHYFVDNMLKLKCTASVSNVYSKSYEEIIFGEQSNNQILHFGISLLSTLLIASIE